MFKRTRKTTTDFLKLKGVKAVRPATPEPGKVTLVVEEGHENVTDKLKIPPGCELLVVTE